MTLDDLQVHSSLFMCDSSYSYAAVDKISTDSASRGPAATHRAVISYGHVFVCPSQLTSRSSIETSERVELVFGTDTTLFFVGRQFGCLRNKGTFL